MDTSERIQLRKAQLYIADEIKRICEENNIKYHLDFGSLLGAIRHNGFIPWDDDMDIGMLHEEYQKFLRIAPDKLRKEFFIDNYMVNPDCPLVYSKVRLKGTKYIESKGNEKASHNEIFVDVIPYYDIADDLRIAKVEGNIMGVISQILLVKAGYRPWEGDGVKIRLKFLPIQIFSVILSRNLLRKIENKLFNKYSNKKFVCDHNGILKEYRKYRIPKVLLENHIMKDFEGHSYAIPKDYDKYLSLLYGNYMTLPPENQRVTHMIQQLDLGEYRF